MSITCSALMCHAPITLPPIAQERLAGCRATTRAMGQAAVRLLAAEPDLVVLIDPHAPRKPSAFGICDGARLSGSFARFGHPEVRVAAQGAPACATEVAKHAKQRGLQTVPLPAQDLSHGACVPLWFLREAGLACPVLVVSLPYPGQGGHSELGHALRAAAVSMNERWALLASGDMSHRLRPDAPAGYHPLAHMFDERFVADIRAGDLRSACQPDPELQALAAEDVVDSCRVVAAACDFRSDGHEVLSYEGPFGVGYLEAVLYEPRPTADREPIDDMDSQLGHALTGAARATIAAEVSGEAFDHRAWIALTRVRARGVFVTLRNPDGSLRGCVGHIEPVHQRLVDELKTCARAAATEDPRFSPIGPHELTDLQIEVSLLSRLEVIDGAHQLDPLRYGVVVTRGHQRGVLLPAIEQVHTASQQLAIACHKGGFRMGPEVRIERFTVAKYSS